MTRLSRIVTLCLFFLATTVSAPWVATAQPDTAPPIKKRSEIVSLDFDRDHAIRFGTPKLRVALIALVQTQMAFFTGADNLIQDGDPAEEIGARLRRARFGFAGRLLKVVDFAVSAEANVHGIDILDAWVGYRLDTVVGLSLGAKKVPFSRFELMGAGRGALIERPLGVRALAPGRQVGLTIQGDVADGAFKYAVGAYNGFERHTNFYQGYVQGTGLLGNRFSRLAFAARLATEPLGPLGRSMADLSPDKGFRLGIGAAGFYNYGKTTTSYGWEVDVHLKIAGFHLAAEFIQDHAAPTENPTTPLTIPAEVTRFAFAAEVGYMILARRFGVTLRVELMDDDDRVENNGDALIVTGGLQYYWRNHHLRASLDFIHREELKGLARDNDTLLLQLQVEL